MSRPDDIAEMIAETEREFGAVDILINNAGIQHVAPIEDFPHCHQFQGNIPKARPKIPSFCAPRCCAAGTKQLGDARAAIESAPWLEPAPPEVAVRTFDVASKEAAKAVGATIGGGRRNPRRPRAPGRGVIFGWRAVLQACKAAGRVGGIGPRASRSCPPLSPGI
jgi:NAD(P)-dependent dehydrogenase (short-subunit alcohol dehydrogenase family)